MLAMLRGQIDTVLEFAICQPILISIIDTRLPFSGASRSKCNALPCALFLAAVLPHAPRSYFAVASSSKLTLFRSQSKQIMNAQSFGLLCGRRSPTTKHLRRQNCICERFVANAVREPLAIKVNIINEN